MAANGGREVQASLRADLGDEGYSQFWSDMGVNGGGKEQSGRLEGLASAQRENISEGKPVHVIKCISSAGERGCAGKTWSLGSPNANGYIEEDI
jgi:hypothetical protein